MCYFVAVTMFPFALLMCLSVVLFLSTRLATTFICVCVYVCACGCRTVFLLCHEHSFDKSTFLFFAVRSPVPVSKSAQANRPLDSKVQEAQRILAKALRRGGKRVLLPGLELRYDCFVILTPMVTVRVGQARKSKSCRQPVSPYLYLCHIQNRITETQHTNNQLHFPFLRPDTPRTLEPF